MIEVNVIGLGFVGLATAVGLSYKNIKVNAIENNLEKLNKIKTNSLPFHEPFLKEKLIFVKKKKKIFFSNKIKIHKNKKNIFFICIGTPSNKNGSTNYRPILRFLKNIKKKIKNEEFLFVIKSTVPPYSINKIFKKIFLKYKKVRFCSNPEFLREGTAWKDFLNFGKIVIGYDDTKTKRNMEIIYKNFKDKKIFVNIVTAEFIKYLSNSMLASMISFSNEMAILAEKMKNIDVKKSFDAIKLDKRWYGEPSIMSNYFHPGLGYGGYCLPKDIKSINFLSKKYNNKSMLNEIDRVNEKIFKHQFNKVYNLNKKLNLFILGLSFKPGSDDLRSSRSMILVKKLIKKNRKITVFDPKSYVEAKRILGSKVRVYKKAFVKKNTVYILSTAWPEYIKFLSKIDKKYIIDLRYAI